MFYILNGYTPLQKYIEKIKDKFPNKNYNFFHAKYLNNFSFDNIIGYSSKLEKINEYRKTNNLKRINMGNLMSLNLEEESTYC